MNLKALAIAATALAMTSAMAIQVTPGGRVGRNTLEAPGFLTVYTDTPTLLDSVTTGFSNPSIQGSVTCGVYLNELGTLDFYVQVINDTSSDPINRITLYDFSGYTTDVGYRTDALAPFVSPGTKAPDEANRNEAGSVVGFDYDVNWETGFNSGVTGYTVVVRTNATEYTTGNVAVINGISENLAGFAPVPEPTTLAVVGLGAIALLRRRRR